MNFNINKLRPHIVSQIILPDLHSQLITTLSCIRFLGIIICSNLACLIILITHVKMTKRSVALFTMKLDLKLSKTYTSLLYIYFHTCAWATAVQYGTSLIWSYGSWESPDPGFSLQSNDKSSSSST